MHDVGVRRHDDALPEGEAGFSNLHRLFFHLQLFGGFHKIHRQRRLLRGRRRWRGRRAKRRRSRAEKRVGFAEFVSGLFAGLLNILLIEDLCRCRAFLFHMFTISTAETRQQPFPALAAFPLAIQGEKQVASWRYFL